VNLPALFLDLLVHVYAQALMQAAGRKPKAVRPVSLSGPLAGRRFSKHLCACGYITTDIIKDRKKRTNIPFTNIRLVLPAACPLPRRIFSPCSDALRTREPACAKLRKKIIL